MDVRLSSIDHIISWPGVTETAFVLTTTLYSSIENHPGDPKWWGYKVGRALERKETSQSAYEIRLAKLLLHEAKKTKEETLRLKDLAHRAEKRGTELISDFLSHLQKFLFGENGYFREHHSSWLTNVKVEYIMGVPAAWSEPEQAAMIEAAIEAGINNPSRGSEPEAMAGIFFALHETSLKASRFRGTTSRRITKMICRVVTHL